MKKIFFCVMCVVLLLPLYAQDFVIHDERSRFNDETEIREETIGIINHDTQGDWPGCRAWVQCPNYGPPLTHYLINRKGRIELICDDWRRANHAGSSRWNGQNDLSRLFIGIEYVGYFDEPLTEIQAAAGKWLNDSLKRKYPNITDEMIIPHAMVACWYPDDPLNPHPGFYTRGRRTDGIRFTTPYWQKKMGLDSTQAYDIEYILSDSIYASDKHNRNCFGRTFSKSEILAMRKSMLDKRDTGLALAYIEIQAIECISVNEYWCIVLPSTKKDIYSEYYFIYPNGDATLNRKKFFKKLN